MICYFIFAVPFPIIERKKIPKFTIAPPDEKGNYNLTSLKGFETTTDFRLLYEKHATY